MRIETKEIQEIIRSYYKSLYSTKLENLEGMDKFLDRYQIPKLNEDQIKHLNSPIIPKEIGTVIKTAQPITAQYQIGVVENSIRLV